MFEPLAPHCSLASCSVLTVCCGCTVNCSLRQSHTTLLCSQSLGSCLSSTAHYSHDKHILLTILNGYVVDMSFMPSILRLNVLESTHSLRPHWSTTLLAETISTILEFVLLHFVNMLYPLSVQFAGTSAFSNFQAAQQVGRQCDPSGNVFL